MAKSLDGALKKLVAKAEKAGGALLKAVESGKVAKVGRAIDAYGIATENVYLEGESVYGAMAENDPQAD